jgi:two-component system, NarL family, response regulator DevR
VPRKTRVLVVDDSYPFARAAADLLAARGYEVVGKASSVAAARDAVEDLAPDAVLLDVRLPDGSGFDLCSELSDQARPPAVLLMSSVDFVGCVARAEMCGAKGFVLKCQLGKCDLASFWPQPMTHL